MKLNFLIFCSSENKMEMKTLFVVLFSFK